MADQEMFDDQYFDEADEFFETEMNHIERGRWEELLSLYEDEVDRSPEEEEASDLHNRIRAIRDKLYGDAEEAQY